MFEDDEAERVKSTPIDRLSVDDLRTRIEALKSEIARCEAELEKKAAHKAAADSIFKTDP